jgi:basic membrane protein A
VRDTDPRVKLLTNFSGDQDDNALSHRIAKAQMAAGADVIFTMLNSGRDGVTQACREAGTRQIGNVIDWTTVDPQVFVASAWADVGIGAFLAVKDMQERGAPGPGIRKIGLSDPAAVRLTMGQGVAPLCASAWPRRRLPSPRGSSRFPSTMKARSFLPDRMVRRRQAAKRMAHPSFFHGGCRFGSSRSSHD